MRPRRIKEQKINVGEPITEPVVDDHGELMLNKGFVFKDVDRMKILNSLEIEGIGENNKNIPTEPSAEEVVVEAEDSPFDLIDFALLQLDNYFHNINNLTEFEPKFVNIAKTIQRVCVEDEDLCLGTIMMSHNTRYSVKHSLQTAIVCEIIGKSLGWNQEIRLSTICAAITMNIGMIELQDLLLKQEEQLSENQQKIVHLHPEKGLEILRKYGIKDEIWLESVLQHHESADGSGYPFGLQGDAILQPARVIKMADIYCARVSGRDYRPPLLPDAAIRQIFLEGEKISEIELANIFVKNLGIYPPGSYVKLKSNELGVVTQRGNKVYTPIVHIVVRSNGYRSMIPLRRDTSDNAYNIVEVIPSERFYVAINRHQLWGYGIFKRQKTLKRKENRFQANILAIIFDMEHITTTEVIIINISTAGCMLKLPKANYKGYSINKDYYLTFRILDKTIENLQFNIKNISETYDYLLFGCQFTELSTEIIFYINNFIQTMSDNGHQD